MLAAAGILVLKMCSGCIAPKLHQRLSALYCARKVILLHWCCAQAAVWLLARSQALQNVHSDCHPLGSLPRVRTSAQARARARTWASMVFPVPASPSQP